MACADEKCVDIFKWPPSGHNVVDSLMYEFQMRHLLYGDDEDTAGIAKKMEGIAARDSLSILAKSRIDYCRATLFITAGKTKEAEKLARHFLCSLDSADNEYDYHAWRQILSVTYNDFIDRYRVNKENIRYFRGIGDSLQTVKSLITLSHIAIDMGDSTLANGYFKAIENLLISDARFDYLRRKMKVNEALIGPESHSDSLLKRLRNDIVLKNCPESRIVILQNSFLYDDSVKHLDEALILAATPLFESRRPILYTLKSFWFEQHESPDSALFYARLAARSRPMEYPTSYSIEIHRALAFAYKANGMTDSAFWALSEMVALEDSLASERQTSKILNTEYSKRLKLMDEKAVLERTRIKSLAVIIILSIFIIAACFVIRWQRIASKRNLDLMSSKSDLRNAANNLKTYSMVVEENERIFDEISHCIESEEHSESLLPSLQAILRKHRISHESREMFVKSQCEADAGFAARIKADYPEITERQIQLARLIMAGLNNSQLSHLLNVTQESIHKSRYRLRQRLNVPKSETLEDFLRKYMHDTL